MFADDKYGHDGRHHLVIIRTNFCVCVGGSDGVIIPSTSETRGWRDGLWLKAVTALVEDPDSVPSTHVTVHYTHHSSFRGGSNTLSGLWIPHACGTNTDIYAGRCP